MQRTQLIAWLDRITSDVQRLLYYETVFGEVQAIIRRNQRFRGKPGNFNKVLFDWFTNATAAGVRRHLKNDRESVSLRRFLGVVHEHPGLVSRQHFRSLFSASPAWLRATADRTFDRYCGSRGKWRARIRRDLVTRDVRAVKGPSFHRIEEWTDRFVAHLDTRGMTLPAPRLMELRACLRTLDRILCRYHLLLKGRSQTTLRATIQMDWTDVFTFAWR